MSVKKISVILCTYNGEKYVREQLESVLAQTYPIYEWIVQDDHSTDATWQILQEYAENHSEIHLFRNTCGKGINANFFSAMSRATGDYIAICDQDDRWEPRKLEMQINAMGDHLLCSGFSRPFSDEGYPVYWDRRIPNYHLLRISFLGVLPGHTLLFHRYLLSYLPQGMACPYLYDWQIQLVAAAFEEIVFVPEVLVHFRRHASAATATKPVTNSCIQAIKMLWLGIRYHRKLTHVVRQRFAVVEQILKTLPCDTKSIRLGFQMSRLLQGKGILNHLHLTYLCVCNRRLLFYAPNEGGIEATLRALCYPFTNGFYYRGILNNKKEV